MKALPDSVQPGSMMTDTNVNRASEAVCNRLKTDVELLMRELWPIFTRASSGARRPGGLDGRTTRGPRDAIIGKGWLPRPMPGYSYPDDTSLSLFGLVVRAMNGDKSAIANQQRSIEIHGTDNYVREAASLAMIERWLLGNGPTFYASADVVRDCLNTDALDVPCSDVRCPIPDGLICLPNSMRDQCDNVSHIHFGFIEANQPFRSSAASFSHAKGYEHRTLMATFMDGSDDGGSLTGVRLTSDQTVGYVVEHLSGRPTNAGSTWKETRLHLLFNLLLVMQSYPRYIERVGGRHSERLHDRSKPAPYTARIARPVVQTVSVERERPPSDSTHESPRQHWRRGHWRRQPHSPQWEAANLDVAVVDLGDGRRGHMAWIEPVMIRPGNSPEKGQANETA